MAELDYLMKEVESVKKSIAEYQKLVNDSNLRIVEQEGGIRVLLEKMEGLTNLVLELKKGIGTRVELHGTELAVIQNDLKFIKYEKLSKFEEKIDSHAAEFNEKINEHKKEHDGMFRWLVGAIVAGLFGFIGTFWRIIVERFLR